MKDVRSTAPSVDGEDDNFCPAVSPITIYTIYGVTFIAALSIEHKSEA